MGTSQSSNGPGPGVPLVPPWVDDIDAPDPPGEDSPPLNNQTDNQGDDQLAPRGRFRDARRAIGGFVRTGDHQNLRRALGHYVNTGYGGSATMSRRLAGTAVTAGRLNGVLQSGRGPDGTSLQDIVLASGNDVNVVLDAIVDATSPVDGTQDRESSRRAVRDALTDLLDRFPDADLGGLVDVQREYVVERYTALDVYGRFCLDMQKVILVKASDHATGLRRLKQIREFIGEQVSAAFRAIRERAEPVTTASVARLTRAALHEAFSVFEEYTT